MAAPRVRDACVAPRRAPVNRSRRDKLRTGAVPGCARSCDMIFRRSKAPRLLQRPLLRLLAINLALGTAVAVVMVVGLVVANPRLGRLILADEAPLIAFGLLLFGFVITFGSFVMGTAIMRLGSEDR
jgi:hypothetical protein